MTWSSRFALVVMISSPGAAVRAAPAVVLEAADRASAQVVLSALRADPFAEQPLVELQRIYQRSAGAAALYADFNQRAARRDATAADLIVLGRLELARSRKPDAQRALSRAIALTDSPDMLRRLGRLLDENGARADAIVAYQRGRTGASPLELRALLVRLGALLLAEGKTPEARAVWDEAKRLTPNDETLRRQIAEALATRGAFREALNELREIESIVEREPQALLTVLRRQAEFARRSGNRALCTEVLLRAYVITTTQRSSPLRAEITLELLHLYKPQRSTSTAAHRKSLDELLVHIRPLQKKSPALEALAGDVLAARGDTAAAAAALRRALVAQPGDPYLLRRLCALETGAERTRVLTALFEVERNDPGIGLDLVAALFEQRQPERAVEIAQALRTRFPDSAALLLEISRLLAKNGRHAEAIPVIERALQIEPDLPDATLQYADELRAVGRQADASNAYFRLVAKDGSIASYQHLIGVLAQRKLSSDLKRAYNEALAKSSGDVALRRDYARWLVASGAAAEALVQWKSVEERTKDNPFLRDYARREIQRLEQQKMLNH